MSVARITEITAASPKSLENVMPRGIKKVNNTLDNFEGTWVKDLKVTCTVGKIEEYRSIMKVTLVLR